MARLKKGIDLEIYKWVRSTDDITVQKKVEELRDMREAAEIKQGELSRILGVFQSQVSALETNSMGSKKFIARYISVLQRMLNINFKQ